MLTTIKGTYQNGQVILEEPAPTNETVPVVVTFLDKKNEPTPIKSQKIIGSLKGKIAIPNDFNEPLDDFNEYMY
ncbi:MAG: DUF2281 domain-containing protein [Chitinophagaceae bacterium]